MYNNMVLYFSSVAALFMQKRKNVEIQINLYTSCNEIVLGYTVDYSCFSNYRYVLNVYLNILNPEWQIENNDILWKLWKKFRISFIVIAKEIKVIKQDKEMFAVYQKKRKSIWKSFGHKVVSSYEQNM